MIHLFNLYMIYLVIIFPSEEFVIETLNYSAYYVIMAEILYLLSSLLVASPCGQHVIKLFNNL